ncbi:MAG: omega-3 polyunsaturated fatty acid synthase subunit, PfaA [Gammaproteobacteria bacterium]|nr:omega-3 polyunsaturated fatty acid synthase subunit, PfaA [Gammaproteobacteria bacterium]
MSVKKATLCPFEPIAVVGVGSLFPGSLNAAEFWHNIKQGIDFIEEILPTHWLVEDYYDPTPNTPDKTYCKRGAFLPTVDFDPVEFGIPPSVLPSIDTSQLLALMVAKQTLEDALGEVYKTQDLSRVSVIIGSSTLEAIQYMAARLQHPIWSKSLREHGLPEDEIKTICERIAGHYTPLQENSFPGLLQNVIAGRIANRFNTGGTNCVVDAACAGSLAALSMSVRELQAGVSDMVITGGVDTLNDIVMQMCFNVVGALSLKGDCTPFSDKADGTVLGEGLGMFALKRLSDAEAQGHRIYGVIRGIGTSSDGRSKSIYAPLAEGQAKAIERAYDAAGYSLSTVELIEAHGTGTKAGDLAEFQGGELAFKDAGETRVGVCALGSIKSQIGHTKSAAGSAGMFKALMALHHKTFPPTIKVDQPNSALDLQQSPFYLNTVLRPWVRDKAHPRRASVSSFGFGGSNYHIALEAYEGAGKRASRMRTFSSELVTFSAESPQELVALVTSELSSISGSSSLTDIAKTSQANLDPKHSARLAVVASNVEDLRAKLHQAVASIQGAPSEEMALKEGIYYAYQSQPGKVMFLFPGQGSQYVGMGSEIAMSFDVAMSAWEDAAGIQVDEHLAIQDVVFPKPGFGEDYQKQCDARIMSTEWAQPALAVHSLSYLRLLENLGIKADYLSGHSFGELMALHAAGVMDDETLIRLARKRGELMRDASSTPGAMLSVFHCADDVLKMLKAQNLSATPANFNSPDQLVLSGSLADIEAAKAYFSSQKIRCQRLQVATGFHSHLVASGCEPLLKYLATCTFQEPALPVFANETAEIYPDKVDAIKEVLAKQLAKPVHFQAQIDNAWKLGVRTFIEVGPKSVLTSLTTRILKDREFHAIHLDKQGNSVHALWHALGRMFSIGMNPHLKALWVEYEGLSVFDGSKTEAKFTVPLNGTNYNKPYPMGSAKKQAVQGQTARQSVSPKVEASHSSQHITRPEVNGMSQSNNVHLIQMVQNLQMQLINSHNHYQKVMAESHMAFLQSISQLANQTGSIGSFPATASAMPNGTALEMPVMPSVSMPIYNNGNATMNGMAVAPFATPVVTAPAAPMMAAPMAPPVSVQPQQALQQSAPVAAPSVPVQVQQPQVVLAATPAPAVAAAVSVNAPSSITATDLEALLLDVVVETTGYPKEMLNMEMSIEADLGIDSIKRVEILSIMVERAPGLPEVDPADLGKLETLGDIVHYMRERKG